MEKSISSILEIAKHLGYDAYYLTDVKRFVINHLVFYSKKTALDYLSA